jgi:hypothetical protein
MTLPQARTTVTAPDPAILATQQLQREIALQQSSTDAKLDALRETISILGVTLNDKIAASESSRNGMLDRATVAMNAATSKAEQQLQEAIYKAQDGHKADIEGIEKRVNASIADQVNFLRDLLGEKFGGVQNQFSERDIRTDQNAVNTKVAVDAALQAAEKAVGKQQESFSAATDKSEASMAKQMDQQREMMAAMRSEVNSKFDDRDKSTDELRARLGQIEGRGAGLHSGWVILIGATGAVGVVIAILSNFIHIAK